jgi:hypothetical protein
LQLLRLPGQGLSLHRAPNAGRQRKASATAEEQADQLRSEAARNPILPGLRTLKKLLNTPEPAARVGVLAPRITHYYNMRLGKVNCADLRPNGRGLAAVQAGGRFA